MEKAQTKKANKRICNVRRLKKLKIDSKILCLFYNSVIASILSLVLAIPCWYDACDKNLQGLIAKFYDKVCRITDVSVHESVEQPSNVYKTKCKSLITKIVNDYDHSMHKYITVLPHGILRVVKGRTEGLDQVNISPSSNQIVLYNVK